MDTFVINITRNYKEGFNVNGNYVESLPKYLEELFKPDDYNPVFAFMGNVIPNTNINIEITISVLKNDSQS